MMTEKVTLPNWCFSRAEVCIYNQVFYFQPDPITIFISEEKAFSINRFFNTEVNE